MTASHAKRLLSEMKAASNTGNKICDEIRIAFRRIVAYGYRCDKSECDCVGGWWDGAQHGIEYTQRDLEEIAHQDAGAA